MSSVLVALLVLASLIGATLCEVIASQGENVTFSCNADSEEELLQLVWIKDGKGLKKGRLSREFDSSPVQLSLNLPSVDFADVGLYQCVWKQNSSNVLNAEYLFVDTDGEYLIAPISESDRHVVLRQHQDSLIPCRPTLPSITLELVKEDTGELMEWRENEIKFDTKLGFTIPRGRLDLNGSILCRASTSSREVFNLTAEAGNVEPCKPFEWDNSGNWFQPNLLVNQSDDVKWVMHFKTSDDVVPFVKWKGPDNTTIGPENSERYSLEVTLETDSATCRSYKLRCIIANADIEDIGPYRLTVSDTETGEGLGEADMDLLINVFEPKVDLTTDFQLDSSHVGVKCRISAYPLENFNFSITFHQKIGHNCSSQSKESIVLNTFNMSSTAFIDVWSILDEIEDTDEPGTVCCNACSFLDDSCWSDNLHGYFGENDRFLSFGGKISIGFAIVVLIFTIALVAWSCRRNSRRKRRLQQELKRLRDDHPPLISEKDAENGNLCPHLIPYPNEIEFPISKLSFVLPLGEGNSGEVWKAEAKGLFEPDSVSTVAVKMSKGKGSFEDVKLLMDEIKIMHLIGKHKNLVSLLGACAEKITRNKLFLIMELCDFGDLATILRKNKTSFDQIALHMNYSIGLIDDLLSKGDLFKWAIDVAKGMQYLVEKKVLHGDLACRNILVAKDGTAKISDFGLSKNMRDLTKYEKQERCDLPWRWLAPECIDSLLFSAQSDVWAYGVVLWEIFTLGEVPYSDVDSVGHQSSLLGYLKSGRRLRQPEFASTCVRELMNQCWEYDAQDRTSFHDLIQRLDHDLSHQQITAGRHQYVKLVPDKDAPRTRSSIDEHEYRVIPIWDGKEGKYHLQHQTARNDVQISLYDK